MNPPQAALELDLLPATEADFEQLHELRLEAMRASLERLGRFDAARSHARFRESFSAEHTRIILVSSERVGFYAVKPEADAWLLDHLYLRPHLHGRGIGSAVMRLVLAAADRAKLPVRVGALRGSEANRFYVRHGFMPVGEAEFDVFYVRAHAP